jgi:hypothetical protein
MTTIEREREADIRRQPLSEYHEELRMRMLYLVNQRRMDKGKAPLSELPAGSPNVPFRCALSRAGVSRLPMFTNRVKRMFGETGVSFVQAFDRRVFKDLIV